MKEFKEVLDKKPIFESHEIQGLSLNEIQQAEEIYMELEKIYESDGIQGFEQINESFLRKLVGGAAGFVVGPAVGKIIAKALGINRGLMYDMLTSRLVGAALGSALTKAFKK